MTFILFYRYCKLAQKYFRSVFLPVEILYWCLETNCLSNITVSIYQYFRVHLVISFSYFFTIGYNQNDIIQTPITWTPLICKMLPRKGKRSYFFSQSLKLGSYDLSVVLFLCDSNIYWKAGESKNTLQKMSCMRICYLKNGLVKISFWFDVSSELIRWNTWDQFQTVKLNVAGSQSFPCFWGIPLL